MNHQQTAAALLILLSETSPPNPADYIDAAYPSAADYAALAHDRQAHKAAVKAATVALRTLHATPGDLHAAAWADATNATGGRLSLQGTAAEYIPAQYPALETPAAIAAAVKAYLRSTTP